MRAALFLRRAKGSFFPNKTGRPQKNASPPPARIFNAPSGLQKPCRAERKIFSAAAKKRAEREKFQRSRATDGKWREIIGNYGKIKMVWGGFGFRICVRKLFAPTPKNEAGFGTVFALPKRFEHILPRAKSAIKCSGKILAKALKRGCGFIFSRNASAAVECGKGKALIIANSIIARFAILAIYIRRTKKSEIFP